MILGLLYRYTSNILRKIYKICITSIDRKEIEFIPRNNSYLYILPDTVIKDLAREDEVVIDVIDEIEAEYYALV